MWQCPKSNTGTVEGPPLYFELDSLLDFLSQFATGFRFPVGIDILI